MSVFLLLAVHLAQITFPPFHILVCILYVALNIVDQQLMHSHYIHSLSIHLRDFTDRFFDFFVLLCRHFLHDFILSRLQEVWSGQVNLSLWIAFKCLFVIVCFFGIGKVDVFEFESCCQQFQLHCYQHWLLEFLGHLLFWSDVDCLTFQSLYILLAKFEVLLDIDYLVALSLLLKPCARTDHLISKCILFYRSASLESSTDKSDK